MKKAPLLVQLLGIYYYGMLDRQRISQMGSIKLNKCPILTKFTATDSIK